MSRTNGVELLHAGHSMLVLPSARSSSVRLPQQIASVHRLLPANADDAAVATAAADGHPAAAGMVWDRFSPLVRGLLRRSLGPQEEVEDLVQDVFLRFFKQLPTLRDHGAVRCFLIGITMRTAGSYLRRRRVRRFLHLTPTGVVPEQACEGDDDEAREALARLYAMLDRFDDADRLAFVLRHIEGLELTEIAESLGVSLATTKRRLVRVTSRLFAMVERDPVLNEYMVSASHEEES